MSAARCAKVSCILAVGDPAMARPERSPFTSATNVGTPADDSPSTIPWRVTVLPVPVAPAISPWRLARVSSRLCALPPPDCAPMKMPLSLTRHLRPRHFAQQQLQRKCAIQERACPLFRTYVDSDEGLGRRAPLHQQQDTRTAGFARSVDRCNHLRRSRDRLVVHRNDEVASLESLLGR